MAHISKAEVERLKREVDLADLVRASGVELTHKGQDLVGRCPFHDDKTPSLVITHSKNLWHCMGACQAGGTVIDWVMRTRRVSFVHAVELLRTGATAAVEAPKRLPAPIALDSSDQQLLDDVTNYYHQRFKECPDAQEYLQKRGISSAETIATFKVGFADRTLGLRLPEKATVAGGQMRERLQRVGILRESGHEHLNGSVVIPITDEHGHTVGMYGRKITPRLREGTPLHLYLPGPHRGVFNLAALKASEDLVLCESVIDALSFHANGIRNVTCAYGVSGFTADIFEAMKAHGTRRVFIAYDADDAGDTAATQLAPQLIEAGMQVYRVRFPAGIDANDLARRARPADAALRELLEVAERMVAPVAASEKAAAKEKSTAELAPTPAAAPGCEGFPSAAPLNATELAAPTAPRKAYEEVGEDLVFTFGARKYRVRGLRSNHSLMTMKVLIKATGPNAVQQIHVDTVDLHQDKPKTAFIQRVAAELGVSGDVIKQDLAQMYAALEQLLDEQVRGGLEPRKAPEVVVPAAEAVEAMALLKDPRLLDRIVEDYRRLGMVGERTNVLVGYLATVSRHMKRPLGVMVMSSSGAGKSTLMDSILAFVPEEECKKYSAMTGQSLFYMAPDELKHKVLGVVEEQGAERTSYALKLLLSEGQLTMASTGKDDNTGVLQTRHYQVEGPVALFVTTTSARPDEELVNRCMVLTVNEGRDQTRAIHEMQRQRRTDDGLFAEREREEILKLHNNAQRLLKPVAVVNNLAPQLTFLDDRTRTRRDHEKYLGLMDAVAFLQQYQRPRRLVERKGVSLECIDVTVQDVALANELAAEVLGRSLGELYPQDRKLLEHLVGMVAQACEREHVEQHHVQFTRRDIREFTGWTDWQVREHLQRLVELEYVVVRRGGAGLGLVYELLYTGGGEDGGQFLMGLTPVSRLKEQASSGHAHNGNGNGHGHRGVAEGLSAALESYAACASSGGGED